MRAVGASTAAFSIIGVVSTLSQSLSHAAPSRSPHYRAIPVANALALNNRGDILTTTSLIVNGRRLPLEAAGQALNDSVGGTTVSGVNDHGEVVGCSCYARGGSGEEWALIWRHGQSSYISGDAHIPAASGYNAIAINNRGLIVGVAGPANARENEFSTGFHALLWKDGSVVDLGRGAAIAVNNQILILIVDGRSGRDARTWLLDRGARGEIAPLEAGRDCSGTGLNDRGDVVGSSGKDAFLWRAGRAYRLPSFPGATQQAASAINDHRQVVGWIDGNAGRRAALWEHGQVEDLNTLVRGHHPTWSEAFAINNRGQILCRTERGTTYLLTPMAGART